MKKKDMLILMWHQVYLSTKAGGYIRLIEFLRRIPRDISYIVLDNSPSIFKSLIHRVNLREYEMPEKIENIRKFFFILWALLEVPVASVIIYRNAQKLIEESKIKILYVPIGEFPQLYVPAILLKKKYPKLFLVVDILNYELPQNSVVAYYRQLRKGRVSAIRAWIIIIMFYVGYFITNISIKNADYVFTVSPQLVKSIKKAYRKETIDYTPSGVDSSFPLVFSNVKKYLGIYVGRITAQKGIYELIAVWSKYVLRDSNAKLAIVGSADKVGRDLLKKEISRLKLEKNIDVFFGASNELKNKLLSQSKLFLHLAKYEPLFPVIGILEGLSYGLPAIIYNMEVLENRMKGADLDNFIYVVDNGDTDKVVSVISNYISSFDGEKEIAFQNARKYAKGYDWDKIAAKEFNVITKLIKKI